MALSGCNVIVKVPDYLKIIRPHAKSNSPPSPPSNFDPKAIKTITPKNEAKSKYGNPSSYVVFGQRYYVLDSAQGFQQTGIASWYGKKFHGRRTSSGETYDMYAMTAAHKSIPLPTYVRVTNLQNNRSVIVRVNDRGPFHDGRIIDLSYSAAYQLDMIQKGTARVHIEAVFAENKHQQVAKFPQQLEPARQSESFYIQKKDLQVINQIPVKQVINQAPVTQAINQAPVKQVINQNPVKNLKQKPIYIQVGAFGNIVNAQNLQHNLEKTQQYPVQLKFIKVKNNVFKRVVIGPIYEQEAATKLFEHLSSQYHSGIRYVNE